MEFSKKIAADINEGHTNCPSILWRRGEGIKTFESLGIMML